MSNKMEKQAPQETPFRKGSLERISSLDKLDQLITIVGPKGWVSLIAAVCLVFVTILWGIFGSISIKVYGNGVLMRTGGVLNVATHVAGRITDISVVPGDFVKRGDVIARVEQPLLLSELFIARQKYEHLSNQLKKTVEQRAIRTKNLNGKLTLLKKRLKTRERLFKEGLVTKQQVIDISQKLQDVKSELSQVRVIALKEGDALVIAREKLLTMRNRLLRASRIISPYTGYVVEVKVIPDSLVSMGDGIVSMEMVGRQIKELEGIIYVPADEGKKINTGMLVSISPTTVKAEEYGSMIAKVTAVSKHSTTFQAMMSTLSNEQLVKQILRGGALIAVNVSLVPDPTTISGYKWTSRSGAPSKIQSGTLCSASITVQKRRPISLIFPTVKKTLGI